MPILARDEARRRLSSRGGERRLIPKWSAAVAGLRRKRERVKASPVRSGCVKLELAQGVEGALADLARDGQSRHRGVAPLAGGAVDLTMPAGGNGFVAAQAVLAHLAGRTFATGCALPVP